MLLVTLVTALTWASAASAQETVPHGEILEAEALATIVGAEPEQKYAQDASGGAYVYLPAKQMEPGEPPLSYIEVPLAEMKGQFTLRVRALALSGGTDSLLIRWASGQRSIGLQYEPPEWKWYEVSIYSYIPGPATLIVGAREPARIDVLEVIRTEPVSSPHQPDPIRPEPNGGRPIDLNPPTFRWLHQGTDRTCRVQVSRTEDFTHIVLDEEVTATFLRPLQPLPTGRLWWRMRADNWDEGLWGAAETFEIPEEVASWPLPPWEESFARVPEAHPRLWLEPGELEQMRRWAEGEGAEAVEGWRGRLSRELGKELPLEAQKERDDELTREEKVVRRVSFKGEAARTARAIQDMAPFYALTGDEQFAEELRRRALLIADLDPHGYASHAVSDFGNGTLVEGMAFAYDFLQDYMSEQELAQVREALAARLEIMEKAYRPRLEQRVHNAHAWQHTFLQFMAGALALYGEHPRAEDWFQWAVKATVALYPWFGGAEGGSAECASYFAGTNLRSSMGTRDLIYAATGIDLLDNPWYRSNVYYTIYSHPPNHMRSQFGDHPGGPWSDGPRANQFLVTRYRAALLDDRFAAAYASAYKGNLVGRFRDSFKWLTPAMPEPAPLSELPDARAFRDIGTVFMHSAIDRPDDNIFFEFKCSPYGSHGHSHNDQNCFNLAAFNEPLLIDTGYYHSYGDAHHAGWTMTTQAHNAILVDGTGQPNGNITAYGRLLAFEQGDEYAYCAGEAKWAYREVKLDRFTRQVLWLKPDLLFLYDQLEAPEPHTYQWLLHAERQIAVDEAQQTVVAAGEKGACRVALLAPENLSFSQTDEFDPPAKRWRKDRKFDMPNQWHLTASTREPAASQRFLAVIEVTRQGEPFAARVEAVSDQGWLGVRVNRQGSEVVAGFADALMGLDGSHPVADIRLGPVAAQAYAVAAELRDGKTMRLVTIGATEATAAGE